jgi:glycine hydroxymethyltransferase
LLGAGLTLVSGGTDNHLLLVDFSGTEMTGKRAQELLDRVGITANKNTVPYDERPPAITSGVRFGTPAMTTRGFGPEEMREVAAIIVETLKGEQKEESLNRLLARSRTLTAAFPLYRTLGA